MTTTLLHPQGDYDLAKAESSRLPGLAAGTERRGRGHLDSAPSFLDESSGQSLTRCWPKQLEYLCMRRQEARGATHWSWIQDQQMILDDAAPMRLTRVMYSVTAMHWGSSGMESEQLDIKSWLVHFLVVDVVCLAASARLKSATTEAKKPGEGTSGTLARCNEFLTSIAEERGTFGLAPIVKVGSSPGKIGCKAVVCVT